MDFHDSPFLILHYFGSRDIVGILETDLIAGIESVVALGRHFHEILTFDVQLA
ncbi:hypothetical protein SDC9_184128 [bioreactor metagenome]|uniref:Uncharacterized protein n=1 Tax=bioreactor metagenome TaxID=1076179 RepID=A0A645HC63_9ZZZZ